MWTDKELYIANKIGIESDDYGNETPYFNKPIKYRFNYMPVSSQVDYQMYGTLVNNMLVTIIDKNTYINKIKSQDLAYLIDSDTQDIERLSNIDSDNKYCPNANYRVKYVQVQNVKLKVVFEKITKGENKNG